MFHSLPTAVKRQTQGNIKKKEALLFFIFSSFFGGGTGSRECCWLDRVLMSGRKKGASCICLIETAVVYSSINPKLCAALTVARKQLTAKWGDQRD